MTQTMMRQPRLTTAAQIEQWWKLLLGLIAGSERGVLPHFTLISCRVVADRRKKVTTRTALVPCLVVRGRMPYDQAKYMSSQDGVLIRAFVEKIKDEIKNLENGTPLAKAMHRRGVRKIHLELIDTGHVRGGGYKNPHPNLLAEKLIG